MPNLSLPKLYPFWQLMLLNIRPFFREPAVIFWTFGLPVFIALLMIQAFSKTPEVQQITVVMTQSVNHDVKWIDRIEKDEKVILIKLDPQDSQDFINVVNKSDSQLLMLEPILQKIQSEFGADLILTDDGVYSIRRAEEITLARNYLMQLKNESRGEILINKQLDVQGYRYVDWLIPGIIVLQILGVGLFSIANGLVSDRQNGLFKRLKLSPFKQRDYIIGIVFARLFLLMFQLIVLLVLFYFLFDFRLKGDVLNIILVLTLGSICLCLIGVLLGSRSKRVEVASGAANLVYFPLMFLSGIYFDTANFPEFLQKIVQWFPSTAFLDSFRLIINQGASLGEVQQQLMTLVVFSIVLFIAVFISFDWGDEK